MALTKLEVLDLFVQHVDDAVIAQRIKQMYNQLGPAEKDAAYALVKADLVAVLTSVRDQLQARDASIDAALADANTELDDIEAAQ